MECARSVCSDRLKHCSITVRLLLQITRTLFRFRFFSLSFLHVSYTNVIVCTIFVRNRIRFNRNCRIRHTIKLFSHSFSVSRFRFRSINLWRVITCAEETELLAAVLAQKQIIFQHFSRRRGKNLDFFISSLTEYEMCSVLLFVCCLWTRWWSLTCGTVTAATCSRVKRYRSCK